ncbi:cellulose binding domain-containing protein [Anaerosporobacter sp.]|uniref:cellulose binding domain-containing protein n=1 Tax=Anaerosporobacter sp. TaxID=1872529 RepID=UPI00286F402E|nr:cellulose binding domain-containing protein [Anaerosporobacter sp.]
MRNEHARNQLFKRILCLLLCVTIVTTGLPLDTKAATTQTTQTKYVKADPEVFVPSAGEKAPITFNLESKRSVNIYVKDGKKVIANLVKNKEYTGNYVPHELVWDGKDDSGNYVSSGTYKIIVEPVGKYSKYQSITSVSVVGDNTQEIYIAPNTQGNVFKVYGKGGTSQGVKKVTLSVKKDGKAKDSIAATIGKNLWYAEVSMESYSLYDLAASIQTTSGTTTSSISAVMHTFRVTDRLEYLASAYYGDYKKDSLIRRDNGIYETYVNSGEIVGSNLLVINPTKKIKQEITSNNTSTNQHLGIIDQLQRTASMNPVSLTMGNNFYENEDLYIGGYIPLDLTRSYNSMGESFHENGMNWTNSYTYFLQNLGTSIAIRFEDGHIEYYTKKSDGTYQKPDGLARELKANANGTYTLTVDGVTIYEFTANGKIKEIKDLNGNATTFTYTDGLLTKIENLSGYFNLTYNTDGTIKTVTDSGSREIKYGYKDGLLTSYTDAEGNKTTYAYDSYNRLNKVVSAEGVVLYDIVYDGNDRVTSKTMQGSTYTYSYDDNARTVTCTEPNKNKIIFHYTEDYRIESEEYSDGTMKYYYEEKSVGSANSADGASANAKVDTNAGSEASSNEQVTANSKTNAKTVKNTAAATDNKDNEIVANSVAGKTNKDTTKSSDITVKAMSQDNVTNILELKTFNMNICTGDMENNTLYPQFRIYNTSSENIALSDVTLRYYFTIDGENGLNFFCDHAAIQDTNVIKDAVTGKFIKLDTPEAGADHYMEVGFTSGTVAPGNYVDIHTRIGKSDWSVFKPSDDYSQNISSSLDYFDQVDMYYNGNLVWGKGSISGAGSEAGNNNNGNNNNGNGNNGNGGNNNNNGNTGNNGNTSYTEEEIIPKGTNNLKLQMYNAGNNGTYANTIHPMMKVVNLGENMVKLSDITIRYYYTQDSNKPQNFWCDWSSAGSSNVTGSFHSLEETFEGADTYVEVGFTEDAGYIDIGATVDLHLRFAKNDWTNYDLTNDHSINPNQWYEDWKKVDVFVNGVKVWGEDLIPSEDEELEVEHMDYADSTYKPVKAEMYNRNRESRSNEISPRFRVYNIGEEAIKLSDLRLNYFYTADGPEEQIFEVDWAAIGSRYQTSISKNEITCTFTEVNDSNLATKCIADIGFKRPDITIQPGEYLELQVRIHRSNWTKYVQTNDFSLNPDSKDYEEWNKIAIFINDRWAYGSIPLSYTDVIDPNLEEEEDANYPVESKESYTTTTDKAGNKTEYTYDTNGNITTIVDALGNTTTNTYNKRGQITTVIDALGNKTTYDYDSKGNLTSVTDAEGNVTKYTYGEKGYLTKITRADGSIETRTYDSKGNVETITDGNGDTVTYGYDVLNQIKTFTDANGGVTKYAYSLNGNVTKVTNALGYASKTSYNKDGQVLTDTDQNGNITSYAYDKTTGRLSYSTNALSGKEIYQYDTMGNVSNVTAPDGGITIYTYDLFGRVESTTDALGGKKTYIYDTNGNTLEEKDELGNVTTYSYDKLDRVITQTDALKNTIMYTYDALGRTVEETDANGGVAKYSYDRLGNLIKTTDANGNVRKNSYNEIGLLKSSTDAEGNKVTYEYDAEGRKTKETSALGNITKWKYDKNGNLTKLTDANGNATTCTYDKDNQVISIKAANGNMIQYEYDNQGNMISETDALGNKTTYTYDVLGNRTSVTDALGKVNKREYNKSNQLVKEIDANGNVTTYGYDKKGNQVTRKNPLGMTTRCVYDLCNQLIEEIDEAGNKIIYTYDAKGNIKETIDAKGYKTTYEYDKVGNLNKVIDSLGNVATYTYDGNRNLMRQARVGKSAEKDQSTSYEYNKNGQVTKLIDALGECIIYTYDAEGKLVKEIAKDGSATKYEYDKVGNQIKIIYSDNRNVTKTYTSTDWLETMTDWNGTTTYEYDANGQVTKVIDAKKQTLQYTWTKLGQKKTIQYPTGEVVSYTYDNNGNLVKVTDTSSGTTTYTYDACNQVKTKKLSNGIESAYTYAVNGWLTRREETGKTSKETYIYEYDKNGNRTKETKDTTGVVETTRYIYDAINQLTSVTDNSGTRTYTFDEFNNRATKQETGKANIRYYYNDLNQLLMTVEGSDVTTYTYDKRGNIDKVEENGLEKQVYTFDSTNKLSKVIANTAKNGSVETVTTKYSYDGIGSRISAKVEKAGMATSNITYVIDPKSTYGNIIMTKNSITGKTSVFTFSDEVISVETSGEISYYKTDEKHSVTDILDGTGKVRTTIEYDEYGTIANSEVISTGGNIFAYTGHVYDESIGLYYAKARYYDAEKGRFISEDNYRGKRNDPTSLNLYTYCTNNSIAYYDPTGYLKNTFMTDLNYWEAKERLRKKKKKEEKGNSITVEQLVNFGWLKPTQKLADEINEAVSMFGINKGKYVKEQMILFMATAGHEAGMGGYGYIQGGSSYKYRGAGALQLTGEENYKSFDDYLRGNMNGYKGEIMKSANPYKVVAEKYAWMSAAWIWANLTPSKRRLDEYMDAGYKLYDCFIVTSSFIQGSRGANEDYKKIAAGKYKKIDYSSVYNGSYGIHNTYEVIDIEVINGGIVVSSNHWNDRTQKFNSAYDAFGGY